MFSQAREKQRINLRQIGKRGKSRRGGSLVRGICTQNRGAPHNCMGSSEENCRMGFSGCVTPSICAPGSSAGCCPSVPGIYNALPRSWCHQWRKYLKTGEGDQPLPPDASALLCDAHKLPLVPPHLESYLYGDTSALLLCSGGGNSVPLEDSHGGGNSSAVASPFAAVPVGYNPVVNSEVTDDTLEELRAAGFSDLEVQSQRLAMLSMESQRREVIQEAAAAYAEHIETPIQRNSSHGNLNVLSPDLSRESINEQLDRENYLVVEILTEEEFVALGKWWPMYSSLYALRFAVTNDTSTNLGANIVWSTPPCRECEASGKVCREFVGRLQRARRVRRQGRVSNGKGR
mmetsp:Transcript_6908/g.14561  ORF Transcript_6908/g.14561 Transcript_6908/m.14561 type:complete len:346 (-) Transcript_6908:99-1136(-)